MFKISLIEAQLLFKLDYRPALSYYKSYLLAPPDWRC